MKIRYIAVPVLLLMLAIILGCQLQQQAQPPAAQQTAPAETVPAQETQPAPETAPSEEEQAAAETAPTASETTSAPAPEEAEETTEAGQTTGMTRKLNKSEYYKVHLAYKQPAPAVREGVVYELLSSTPGRVVGTIRPDGETRRYPFQSALQLKRYDRVRFTMNAYGEMQNLQFVSHAVEPARNATVRNVSP